MTSDGKRWELVNYRPRIEEQHPYDECPRCGEFRFREVKLTRPGSLFRPSGETERKKECKHCRFVEDQDDD